MTQGFQTFEKLTVTMTVIYGACIRGWAPVGPVDCKISGWIDQCVELFLMIQHMGCEHLSDFLAPLGLWKTLIWDFLLIQRKVPFFLGGKTDSEALGGNYIVNRKGIQNEIDRILQSAWKGAIWSWVIPNSVQHFSQCWGDTEGEMTSATFLGILDGVSISFKSECRWVHATTTK